jgi:hypothetical protein
MDQHERRGLFRKTRRFIIGFTLLVLSASTTFLWSVGAAGTVIASPVGSLYNAPVMVNLEPSEPGETILFTIDGTTPVIDPPTGTLYVGDPIAIPVNVVTTLKFVGALNPNQVLEEIYTIDLDRPDAPTAPDLAEASDTGRSTTDNLTRDTTPRFTGSAEVGARVRIMLGGESIGSAVADDGTYNIVTGLLAPGVYALTATATDSAGNTSPPSDPINITIDTVAPVVGTPRLAPASDTGASNSDALTRDTSPTVTGTAEDGSTVRLFVNDVAGNNAEATTTGYTITMGALTPGSHVIAAQATDAAGNISTHSADLTIRIDTTPPAVSTPNLADVSDTGSSTTDNLTRDTTPTFIGMSEADAVVEIVVNGVVKGTGDATGGEYNIQVSTLSSANHDVDAKTTDAAGNVGWSSTTLNIMIDTMVIAPTVPDLDATSDTGDSDADDITRDTTPRFVGVAEVDAIVTLLVDGVAKGSGIATDGTYSITSAALAVGDRAVTAIASDVAGNRSGVSESRPITIDTRVPIVSASVPGGLYNKPQSISLSASEPAVIHYTTDGTTPAVSSPQYMVPVQIAETTTLKFIGVDRAGNRSLTAAGTYTITLPGSSSSARVGPPGSNHGFPVWYEDAAGIRLELCVERSSLCLSPPPNPGDASVPDNFPRPALWWSATASMPTNNGGSAVLQFSLKGNFFHQEMEVGDQATYAQIDLGVDNLIAGETYKVTHPYGEDTFVARNDGPGGIRFRDDFGCETSPCDFALALSGRPGPWLRWDPSVLPVAPVGYIGDPAIPHRVTGSPIDTNFFRIEGPDVGGPGVNLLQTNLFSVQGKRSGLVSRANPVGGLYNTAKSVTLTASEPAAIYYTTDGTMPTASSARYSVPIRIAATTTLKFVAINVAGHQSPVRTERYTIDAVVPSVSANIRGGWYNAAQSVALTASEAATIYYTTDGTTPTSASRQYSTPISIDKLNATTTLKFIVVDRAGNRSSLRFERYVLDTIAPIVRASLLSGWYSAPQSVALTASEAATIYYTMDGTTPTSASRQYSGPISIDRLNATTTLTFMAVDRAGNRSVVPTTRWYILDTVAPVASVTPVGGWYRAALEVRLRSSEYGRLYYTVDGTTPTTGSSLYGAPITIGGTTTLKFLAVDRAGNFSEIGSERYILDTVAPIVSTSPRGGWYNAAQSVALAASEQATIYFTTDGTAPTAASAQFSTPIPISAKTALRFRARDRAGNWSAISLQTYQFDTVPPAVTASIPGGLYNATQSVALAASEQATIYYTTDGTAPTSGSTQYSTPFSIRTTTTLKFMAVDRAGNMSPVRVEQYTIDTLVPGVGADIRGGWYNAAQSVALTASEAATIYYTMDGTTPTSASRQYSTPISIDRLNATTTLKFIAVDRAGNRSVIPVTRSYILDTVAPTVTATPRGGQYTSARSVKLVASEPAVIYFSTDGTEPTVNSTPYTGPVTVSTSLTLRFMARDRAGNLSSVVSEMYIIGPVAP